MVDIRREGVGRTKSISRVLGVLITVSLFAAIWAFSRLEPAPPNAERASVWAGDILGRVAVPGRLKAELKIPETQAKDVEPGLPAAIDTRNGVVAGKVMPVDPAAREGKVTVDVALAAEVPEGTRPDQNIDGTIEIDRLDDTLKMVARSSDKRTRPLASSLTIHDTPSTRSARFICSMARLCQRTGIRYSY